MKKSSLALMTSAIISLPICSMELEKKQTEKRDIPVTTFDIIEQCTASKTQVILNHDTLQKVSSPSRGAKQCLEIMKAQSTLGIPEWQTLLGYYANDKEGEVGCEQCAELVSNFIKITSKENCTIGLQASIYTQDLDMAITHPESRAELMQQFLIRQPDTGPALQYLSRVITLYGPDYENSSFIQICNILCDANAFDEKALTSFKNAQNIFNKAITKLENNRSK